MISDFYTESFTVSSRTATVSSIGSYTATWATLGTFKGFMDYLSGQERQISAQYIDRATHIIGCSSTCSWITALHRITDADGKKYRVLHTDNPVQRDHHLELLLEYNESDNLST